MTTKGGWDQLGQDFRQWLESSGVSENEFNNSLPRDKVALRRDFEESERARTGITTREPLEFFRLAYDYNNPHGSSGVPHIHHNLTDFPPERMRLLTPQRLDVSLERFFHRLSERDNGIIYYSRELHVQNNLEALMKDVIRSCSYDLWTDMESSLNGLKIDIGVLRNSNRHICGTMEVKQPRRPGHKPPDPEPMHHPKVISQVASQLIPLRTLYGLKEVYGILSTYQQWRFFKYELEEEDEEIEHNLSDSFQDNDPFKTPQKNARPKRNSPPMSPQPCKEDECYEEEEDEGEGQESSSLLKRGTLYVSEVVQAGPPALEMLAWILKKMAEAGVTPVKPHDREFLYVVRKGDTLGGYEKVSHSPDEYKGRMPNSRNTKLYLLETLGHGDHGRVYRAMSKTLNLCVLKFFIKSQSALDKNGALVEITTDLAAQKAAGYWNKAYEKWLPQATHGKWGGGDAVVMPDLEKMSLAVDVNEALEKLERTMKSRFYDKGIWHGDPAWRNVALVRNSNGTITKVCMIDLEPNRMTELFGDQVWEHDFSVMWEAFKNTLLEDYDAFCKGELLDTEP